MYSASASSVGVTTWSRLARVALALMSLECGTCFAAIPPIPPLKDLPSWAQQQQAPVRRALVIGIADYAHVPPLKTPAHDADKVASELSSLPSKFIVSQVDVKATGRLDLISAIKAFASTVQVGDIVLVYYSGHGLEKYGRNYLVPSDATLPEPGREGFVFVSLDFLIDTISATHPAISLVVLDACRANPFSDPSEQNDVLEVPGASTVGNAAATPEIAASNPASGTPPAATAPLLSAATVPLADTANSGAAASPDAAASAAGPAPPVLTTPTQPLEVGLQPINTSSAFIVAFAASPGHAAYSLFKGEEPSVGSIFTRRLVADIDTLDQPMTSVLSVAAEDVERMTHKLQIPFVNSSKPGVLLLQSNENLERSEEEAWRRTVANSPASGLLDGLYQFLAMFPAGQFSATARQEVSILEKPKTPFLAVANLGSISTPAPVSGALRSASISAPRLSSQLIASMAYVTHDLNVRAAPREATPPILKTLKSGDQVAMLESESRPGWVKVLTADGSVGYVGSVVTDSLRSKAPPLELTLKGDDFDALTATLKSAPWQSAVASPSSIVTVSTALSSESDPLAARRTAFLRSLRMRAALIAQGVPTSQVQIKFDADGTVDTTVIKVIPGASK